MALKFDLKLNKNFYPRTYNGPILLVKYEKAYGEGSRVRRGGGLFTKVVCYPRPHFKIFFIVLLIGANFSYKLAFALHGTMGSERLT